MLESKEPLEFNKLLVVFVAKALEKERAEKGFKRFGQTTSGWIWHLPGIGGQHRVGIQAVPQAKLTEFISRIVHYRYSLRRS